jgi:hypothetical protein
MTQIHDVDHVERFQLGVCALVAGAVIGLAIQAVARHPVETAQIGGIIGGIYVVGYLARKVIDITPYGRARAAQQARDEAERQYAASIPTTMVVLHGHAKDGRYESSVCTVFGETTELFQVGPGSAVEIAEQAQTISDKFGARALCVYEVGEERGATYLKSVDGVWNLAVIDSGSQGVGRLSKRAAANQRVHGSRGAVEQTALAD